jgi:hypothetical protein
MRGRSWVISQCVIRVWGVECMVRQLDHLHALLSPCSSAPSSGGNITDPSESSLTSSVLFQGFFLGTCGSIFV